MPGEISANELQQLNSCSLDACCPRPGAQPVSDCVVLRPGDLVQGSGSGSGDSGSAYDGDSMDLMATAGQAEQAATGGQANGGEGQLALSRSRASWALAELAAPPPDAGEVGGARL